MHIILPLLYNKQKMCVLHPHHLSAPPSLYLTKLNSMDVCIHTTSIADSQNSDLSSGITACHSYMQTLLAVLADIYGRLNLHLERANATAILYFDLTIGYMCMFKIVPTLSIVLCIQILIMKNTTIMLDALHI